MFDFLFFCCTLRWAELQLLMWLCCENQWAIFSWSSDVFSSAAQHVVHAAIFLLSVKLFSFCFCCKSASCSFAIKMYNEKKKVLKKKKIKFRHVLPSHYIAYVIIKYLYIFIFRLLSSLGKEQQVSFSLPSFLNHSGLISHRVWLKVQHNSYHGEYVSIIFPYIY